MEQHFLSEFVSGSQEFAAEPWYNVHGDCITYQTVDEAVVGDRIDGILTIYRSAVSGKPIGYQIKGVSYLVRKYQASLYAVL